jgi:hypothetical protein
MAGGILTMTTLCISVITTQAQVIREEESDRRHISVDTL